MRFFQKEITIPGSPRGFHLITGKIREALPEIKNIEAGILQIFIKHTSAGLTINENADPSVRRDFERFFSHQIPDDTPYFEHTTEGQDDMPAHIKNALLGNTVSLPITKGSINLGIWQGVYLCEFRNHAPSRNLVLTLMGS